MYQYAVGAFFFVAVWAVMLLASPGGRDRIAKASLLCSVAGPIAQYWHRADYWQPVYVAPISIGRWTFGVEDLLFAGALAGIGVGIYEPFIRRSGVARLVRLPWKRVLVRWGLLIGCATLGQWVLTRFARMNSVAASNAVLVFLGSIASLRAPRAVLCAVPASLSGAALMWLFYWGFYLRLYPDIIRAWWKADALCGITLAGVPIEEVLWGAVATWAVGPVFQLTAFARKESERGQPLK